MSDHGRYEVLRGKIASLPRISLTSLPTPLQEAPHLSALLGGPRLFFKRDDLTGLALGGNKARMIEFRLPNAVLAGADPVVAGYGLQSNHACQIAAACARLGMECHLVLRIEPDLPGNGTPLLGNTLLHDILGAKVIRTETSVSNQIELMRIHADGLRKQGRKPFVTGLDDYDLSSAAYAACMLEMCRQFEELGENPDVLLMCSEGATQAGLICAAKYLGMKTRIIGISPIKSIDRPGREPEIKTDIARLATLCAQRLGIKMAVSSEEVENFTRYVGEGYGIVYPEAIEAIRTVARTEGIFLDPVYTGKAMAGLMDLIRRKEIDKNASVVFIHTGGCPLFFLYGDELTGPAVPAAKAHPNYPAKEH